MKKLAAMLGIQWPSVEDISTTLLDKAYKEATTDMHERIAAGSFFTLASDGWKSGITRGRGGPIAIPKQSTRVWAIPRQSQVLATRFCLFLGLLYTVNSH